MRGQSPWERHARGDELFYVIAGSIRFRLLAKSGERRVAVPEGGVFIVPRGVPVPDGGIYGWSCVVLEDPDAVTRLRLCPKN